MVSTWKMIRCIVTCHVCTVVSTASSESNKPQYRRETGVQKASADLELKKSSSVGFHLMSSISPECHSNSSKCQWKQNYLSVWTQNIQRIHLFHSALSKCWLLSGQIRVSSQISICRLQCVALNFSHPLGTESLKFLWTNIWNFHSALRINTYAFSVRYKEQRAVQRNVNVC